MAEKMDLRVRMTRKLLTDALSSLLMRTPFEDLSVVDICQEAQVHRTTFYKHFEDKTHLLQHLFDLMTEELDREGQHFHSPDFHQQYVHICGQILNYIAKNATFFNLGVFSDGNEIVRETFHSTVVHWLQRQLEAFSENHQRFALPVAVIAEYTAGSLSSLALWWLKNNMFVSINEVISYVDALSGNAILLDSPEDKKS